MDLSFVKMHGIGNDYIYILPKNGAKIEDPAALSKRLSHRHFGIGGDGLVLILPSESCDFTMKMYNADGSEGKMCGNAIRCIGKYVYEHGLTDKTSLAIDTASGVKYLTLFEEKGKITSVKVDMGTPVLNCDDIPIASAGDTFIGQSLHILKKEYVGTAVSMGNPHLVIFMNEVEGLPLSELGPHFENHPLFPERTNTEFVEVLKDGSLYMRVYERGSGETMACGTGACAAVVAACLCGHAKRGQEVTVHLEGGDLVISWSREGTVWMTGPCEEVFAGTITNL